MHIRHRECSTCPSCPTRGSSLAEVAVALGLAALLLTSVAPVVTLALESTANTRQRTMAAALASSQLERLRSLPWYALPGGGEARDLVTLLQADEFLAGGPGLSHGSLDSLDAASTGYVDTPPPVGALPATSEFTRRWAVLAHSTDPACVVLIVEVAPTTALASGRPMAEAASARAQTVRCRTEARP